MFRLVIVDDEKMIRNGLVQTISWAELGIEVVGTAANGIAALEIIRNTKPHIVLTDIRMPKMDGLELTRILHEELPDIKVIIISGYEEFSYAQKALQYQAVDYILKPVGVEALVQIMKKLTAKIQAEFEMEIKLADAKHSLETEMKQYLNLLSSGQEKPSLEILETMFNRLKSQQTNINQFKKFALELCTQAFDLLKKCDSSLENLKATYPYELSLLGNQEEIKAWLEQFSIKIVTARAESIKGGNYHAIKKALEYIEAHYQEDLSINMVAEQVYLSPSYFSHIFKKIRGEGFIDYLNAVRIAKAKELLKESRYKVYEVSNMVGYKDYKYFSSVFKKITGVSPTEYALLDN